MPPLPLFHSETLVSGLRTTEMFLITALRLSARGAAQADWRDGFGQQGFTIPLFPFSRRYFPLWELPPVGVWI